MRNDILLTWKEGRGKQVISQYMLCDPGVGADATPERALRTEAYFLFLADHVTPRDAEMRDSDWLPTQNIMLSQLSLLWGGRWTI